MDKGNAGTVIGTNVKLTGTLQAADDIAIYGRVDGEVLSAKNVLIGETATVKGPIAAKIVTVTGKVRGSINASEKLEILQGGKVYGSIATSDLIIHSKALFVGKSEMAEQEDGKVEVEEDKPEEPAVR